MFSNYPDILTVSQAAEALHIGKGKMYELLHTGIVHSLRIGRNIRIPKSWLIDYIDSQNTCTT